MKKGKMVIPLNSLLQKTFAYGALLSAPLAVSRAAVATWDVTNPPNNGWSISSNWAGGITPPGNDVLFTDTGAAGSANTVTNTVDGAFSVNSLSYNGSALFHVTSIGPSGSLTLGGNVTTTGGISSVINLSGGTLDLGGNSLSVTTFNATSGTLRNLGQFNSGATLVKTGAGVLTVGGLNAYTGTTSLQGGALVLTGTASSTAGVSITGGSRLELSLANGSTGAVNSAAGLALGGGRLEVKPVSGAASQTLGNLTMSGTAQKNTIQVASGGTLTLGNTWTRTANSADTLRFDLSGGGTVLSVPTATTNNGVISGGYAVVTDASGATGFAATGTAADAGKIVRFVPANVLAATAASNVAAHYRTSGNIGPMNGSKAFNSLTINTESGPGSLNLGGFDMSFRNRAIVVSGTGNYTISNGSLQNLNPDYNSEFIIHQYSTGTLTVNANISTSATVSTNNHLVKAGTGAMVFNGTSRNGALYVQEGLFVLNGMVLSSARPNLISRGAILAGTGTLGLNASSNTTVEAGGTFRAEGLTFNGNLSLQSDADIAMTLSAANAVGATVTGNTVSINGSDLVLTLNYVPTWGDSYTLINNTGAGSIVGTFATINGAAFGPENSFTLSYLGNDYQYQVFYNDPAYGVNDVVIRAVPEPGAVALVGLAGMFLLLGRRVKRSNA